MAKKHPRTPIVNCEFCGRDTTNKCRICRACLGGHQHLRESASATMTAWDQWEDEDGYDYSEDALGPKGSDVRTTAIWMDEQQEYRKHRD